MTDRGLAPVVGVVILVAITAILAGIIAVFVLSYGPSAGPPQAAIAVIVDAESGTFEFIHEGGDPVRVDELRLEIAVDGESLVYQPTVPFFSETGFRSGPTGPFNAASENTWRAGEHASFELACSNGPKPTPGTIVTVDVYVTGSHLVTLEVVAD